MLKSHLAAILDLINAPVTPEIHLRSAFQEISFAVPLAVQFLVTAELPALAETTAS